LESPDVGSDGNGVIVAVEWGLLALAAALLGWRLATAVRVWRDARHHGLAPLAGLGWAALAVVYPARYWWGARLKHVARDEAQPILDAQATRHGLAEVGNVRCPLCDAELVHVLTVSEGGALAIRSQAVCPRCDFRVDACRHCRHFTPAPDGIGGQVDMTHGRCQVYKAPQPVAEAYPNIAQQLTRMGYDSLNSPKPILDSYQPLEECRSFALHLERLEASRVPWLNRQRAALVALAQGLSKR
jgi:hypothetical protein